MRVPGVAAQIDPVRADEETEPNDGPAEAQALPPGRAMRSHFHRDGDVDGWALPPRTVPEALLALRLDPPWDGVVSLSLHDAQGREIREAEADAGETALRLPVPEPARAAFAALRARFGPSGSRRGRRPYHLRLRAREDTPP